MKLLGAVLYDPTSAVTKGTAASAMAAFDTTNARITFTVPAHGKVRVVVQATIHGATTFSQILLGALEGATVRGRVVPQVTQNGTALATTMLRAVADYIVTGLSAGSVSWDAAWGIETFVANSLIKYGGPDNTTANDAFGALVFQVWDPDPTPTNFSLLSIDANGRVDVAKVAGTAQTARDLGAQLDAAVSTRLAAASYTAPDNTRPANFTSLSIDGSGRVDVAKVAGTAQTARDLGAQLDATVSSRAAAADYTALRATALDNLDAAVSSRSTLTQAGVRSAVGMASANLDTQLAAIDGDVLTRLATSSYTAPDNARPANFTTLAISAAGIVSADIKKVNAVTVNGDGGTTPWGP